MNSNVKKHSKFGGGYSLLTGLLLVIIGVLTLLLYIVSYRSGYGKKILTRLELVEEAEPNDAAASSWASCLANLDIDVSVAFFGDSLTRWSPLVELFDDLDTVNLGYSGNTVFNMRSCVGMISAVKAEKVFVHGGINDLINKRSMSRIIEDYDKLLDGIVEECPGIRVYVLNILPVNSDLYHHKISNEDIKKLNALIEELCVKRDMTFIDLYSLYEANGELPDQITRDGIHLTEDAYDVWAEAIGEYVYE